MHFTRFITIKLHEDVIPNLDETISILIRASGRSSRDLGAMVIENFGTRTTGACIAHHPKVIRCIARAFVIPNSHNSFFGNSDLLEPNVVRFIILGVDRYPQFIFREFKNFG